MLGCIIEPVAIRQREEILNFYPVLMRPYLKYRVSFGAPQYRMATDILEHVQWKATEIRRGLLQDKRRTAKTTVQP